MKICIVHATPNAQRVWRDRLFMVPYTTFFRFRQNLSAIVKRNVLKDQKVKPVTTYVIISLTSSSIQPRRSFTWLVSVEMILYP